MKIVIFGAKSIALGVFRAVQRLYEEFDVEGFLVTSKKGNPDTLAGLPVYELDRFEDRDACILIATPQDTHIAIVKSLEEKGFHSHICIDSKKESDLMGKYYAVSGEFKLLRIAVDRGQTYVEDSI